MSLSLPLLDSFKERPLTSLSLRYSYASVLISVRKSDESLRKIRKSRKTPFSLFGGSSAGSKAASEEAKDEDNIKLQILLDVEGLRKDAESMGVKVKESKAWVELKGVVLGDGESFPLFGVSSLRDKC